MTEEAKNEVVKEEQPTDNVAIADQADPVKEPAKTEEPKEGSKEYNFRALEQSKKEIERRLQQQEAMNKEMMEFLKQQKQSSQPQEEVLPQLNPDDIPEWQHVSKYVEKQAETIAEKKIREFYEKQEKERLPKVVREKYQDFDEIVTSERIEKLEKENPELAKAFSQSKDPYSVTYSYLKGIYGAKKQSPEAMEEAEKIMKNSQKPVSSNAAGTQGALKHANAFQKKSREELYKEMMQYASQA